MPVGPILYVLLALLGWAVAVDAMRRIARRMDGRPAAVVVAVMAVTGLLLLAGGWVFYSIYLLAELVRSRVRPGGPEATMAPQRPVEVN